ncbi:MAG: ParA family protein [Shimia sp.]
MGRKSRVVAITNQKGGVGKTTTAINFGAALTERGASVLLIDLDPQGNASTGLGIDPDQRTATSYDVLVEGLPIEEAIFETGVPLFALLPASTDLSSADIELMSSEARSTLLQTAINGSEAADTFDYILLDCPPSLNLLTVNALVAADSVLIPLQSEFFALEGLSQLMLTVRDIRASANAGLRIEGVVLTMYDRRNNLSQQVEADARENLGDLVLKTVIPRNVRLSEAPSFAQSVLQYDPQSAGARAYLSLADEVLSRNGARAENQGAYHG